MPLHGVRSLSLGQHPVDTVDANSCFTFIAPKSDHVHLVLVFHDAAEETTRNHFRPDWPLSLTLRLCEFGRTNTVIETQIQTNAMRYANWFAPSTSVILDIAPALSTTLQPGVRYEIALRTRAPLVGHVKTAEVFLRWTWKER